MRDYIPPYLLRRWITQSRRGTRYERRRAVKALHAFARGDNEGAYRAVYGITPRVRQCAYERTIHPAARVRGGGEWRTA